MTLTGWRAMPAPTFAAATGRTKRAAVAGGVGQQDLERCASRAQTWSSSGISIARLRILPVGPFGSSSTNHTCRGYL